MWDSLLGKLTRKEREIAMKSAKNRHSATVWWTIGGMLVLAATAVAPRLLGADQATEDRAFFVAKGRVTYRVYSSTVTVPKAWVTAHSPRCSPPNHRI